MRKFKILSMILIALASSVVFIACSCAPKRSVAPRQINISSSTSEIYVGETHTIDVSVLPENATDVIVSVSSTNTSVATISKNSISGVNGQVVVTGVAEGVSNIEFIIKHSDVAKKVHTITVIQKEQLSAPTNVEFNETTNELQFDADDNANEFELEITNVLMGEVVTVKAEHETLDNGKIVVNLLKNNLITIQNEYKIRVKALGHGKKFLDSDYNAEPISVLKLQTPQNLRFEDGKIMWDKSVINEVTYKFIYKDTISNNEIEQETENNFVSLSGIKDNEKYSLKVKAVHKNAENVYASDWSELFEVYQLSEITGQLENQNKMEAETANSVYKFSEVIGATAYKVFVLNQLQESQWDFEIETTDRLEIEIDERFENGKTYILRIVALGNGNNIIDSKATDFEFTKHSLPTNFKFANGYFAYSFSGESTMPVFEIVVRNLSGGTPKVFTTVNDNIQLSTEITEVGRYEVFIRSVSKNQSGQHFANSDKINTGLIYNKLSKPQVVSISNNSQVVFTEIEGSQNYHFYINGTKTQLSYVPGENGLIVADISNLTKNYVAGQEYFIAIAALNEGQTSSRLEDAGAQFKFTKLATPSQNYQIIGDTISWDAVENAQMYNVRENNSSTVVSRLAPNYTMQNVQQSNNQIAVVAVGNNFNTINSNEFVFNIAGQQLQTPQNIKVENGEFKWDFADGENYEIFIENEESVFEKVATVSENDNFNISNILLPNQDTVVGIRAVPQSGTGKLGSAMVVVTLHKLHSPASVSVSRQATNYKDYYLTYEQNMFATNYKIVATHANNTNNFTEIVGANSFKISDALKGKESGVYNITVTALGTNDKVLQSVTDIGYLTSVQSDTYQVVKLSGISNIVLQDGIITFSEPVNANGVATFGYMVKLTDDSDVLIDEIFTETNELNISSIMLQNSNVNVYVKAVANLLGSVNSDYSQMEETITTLSKVQNVRVEGGKIVWDNHTESPRPTVYNVYVQLQNQTEPSLVAQNIATTEFELDLELPLNEEHKVFVVAKSIGYFNSNLSDELVVRKLPTVLGFEINFVNDTHELSWNLLLNEDLEEIASGYEIVEINGSDENIIGTVSAGVNTLPFTSLDVSSPGSHTLKVRAIGGTLNNVNYITSDYSNELNVVVLAKVNSLKVENGMLLWQHSFTSEQFDKPVSYEITISNQDPDFEDRVFNLEDVTESQFIFPHDLPAGQYSVKVVSVGELSKITSVPATITVVKADTNNLNLRTENGVITWDLYGKPNTVYEIYLAQNNFKDENSYELVGKTNNNYYEIEQDKLLENTLYQVKIKIVPAGRLSSMLSDGLQVVKLPQVQNFAINKGANNNPHYFSWEQVVTTLADYEDAVSGYKVVPQFDTTWSEGYTSNDKTELSFSFPKPGEYKFAIVALGNSVSAVSENIAFINSNQSNVITLVVLDSVEDIVVEDGLLVINHSPLYSNHETQPENILIVVEGDADDEDNEFYNEYVLPFAEGDGKTVWNFKDLTTNELLPSGAYVVSVFAVSNSNNIINSYEKVLTNVVVLNTPTNLNSLSGEFDIVGSDTQNYNILYEVYLDNQLKATLPLENINDVNLFVDSQTKQIKVRAIAQGAIYSNFSESLNITKLQAVSGIRIENISGNATLYWNNVVSSDGEFADNTYRVYFTTPSEDAVEALKQNEFYNEEFGYLEIKQSGEVGYNLPQNLPSGNYTIYMVAVGGEIDSGASGKTLYINSSNSQTHEFYVVGPVVNLSVDKGVIKWYEAPNAHEYKIYIYEGHEIDVLSTPVTIITTKALQLNLNTLNLTDGAYSAKVVAQGNQKQNITGGEFELVEFNKGEPANDFRVLNGYLTWTITEDVIKHYATGSSVGGGTLLASDFDLVREIILNTAYNVDLVLLNNLRPIVKPVFAVRKEGTTNFVNHSFAVYSAEVANREIIVQYNFNLPEGRYNVRAVLEGNKLLTDIAPQNDSVTLSILEPIGDQPVIKNVLHVNSLATENMQVFKLPAPITPQPNSTVSVVNNQLTFNLVTTSTGTWTHYVIVGKDKLNSLDDVVYKIPENEIVSSGTTHAIDVREITGLTAGFTYDLVVLAMGSPIGSHLNDISYLTSSYTTQSEITILSAPVELNTSGGKVAFRGVSGANNYIFRIWNDSQLFINSSHEPSVNRVRIELDINEVLTNPAHVHHKYLSFVEGVYYYDLENNPHVPENMIDDNIFRENKMYYVSVSSQGDGTKTINSKEQQIDVVKWITVKLSESEDKVVIENGKFKWRHVVAYNINQSGTLGGQYRPDEYKVVIMRESAGIEKENVAEVIIEAAEHLVGDFVFYELPDTDDFAATDEFGNVYSYSIAVSAYGDMLEGTRLYFATGNSIESITGERLGTPTGITTVGGVLEWNYVPYAGNYDFELVVADGAVVRNVGNTISYDLSDPEFNEGVFMLSVKAYGSGTARFLNSRRSEQVKVLKLPTPKLRVEDGQIKWNNEEQNLSQNYTKLLISGPQDFDIYTLSSMADVISITEHQSGVYEVIVENHNIINIQHELSLKEAPVGSYDIQVQYIGSSGPVVQANDSFLTTNSNIIKLTTTKLASPIKNGEVGNPGIVVRSSEENNNTFTFVMWSGVDNATNYNVVAIKLPEGAAVPNENGYLVYDKESIINKVKFTYNDPAHSHYFTVEGNEFKFNLRAIIDYDNSNHVLEDMKFGDDYFVYVEAFAADANAIVSTTISAYSLSSDSNLQPVKVPLTPDNLRISVSGLVTWTNRTQEANPILRISYIDGGETITNEINMPIGTTSYQLTLINPNYSVEIRSEAGGQSSGYSPIVNGAFTIYASGNGDAINPYIISNADQLYMINYHTNKHFKLVSDINLSVAQNDLSQWRPIGQAHGDFVASEFTGVLDGNGHSVSLVVFNSRTQRRLGFIDTIGTSGLVKNLTLNIEGNNINIELFGGLAVTNRGMIQNVEVIGSITSVQSNNFSGIHQLGGITAENHGYITTSINKLNILSATNSSNTVLIGGITYLNSESGIITMSANEGGLIGIGIGGLVYMNQGNVNKSYNIGSISAVVNGLYNSTVYVGGLIGTNELNATLSDSYALLDGIVTLTNNTTQGIKIYAGGLIGANNQGAGMVQRSYAVFDVVRQGSAIQEIEAGGIVGRGNSNSYANVFFRESGSMRPVPVAAGNIPSNLQGTERTDSEMKQQAFVTALGSQFRQNTSGYPQLTWQQ